MKPAATRLLRYASLCSYFALLTWVVVWHSLLDQSRYSAVFVFVVYVAPLLLPLRGLLKGSAYTHAWANFVTLIYLIHGITIAYAEPAERGLALIEIVLSVLMFISCSGFARYRGRELGLSPGKLKDAMAREKQQFEGNNE